MSGLKVEYQVPVVIMYEGQKPVVRWEDRFLEVREG
jgi:hypothetical protein